MPRATGVLLLPMFLSFACYADDVLTIAVASNFKNTADEIVALFTAATNVRVRVSAGATGKLYAQIVHGAPYDVFLAADSERPELLEKAGLTIVGSRMTYAIGGLVLWSLNDELRGKDCRRVLDEGDYKWLAIANPVTAPYGRAAKEFLISTGLWDDASGRTVIGENVSQALHFVVTQNATLGLVAAAQVAAERMPSAACHWHVPATRHAPIVQQAVVLARTANRAVATRFLDFLREPRAVDVLQRQGYDVLEKSSAERQRQ